MYDIYCNNLTKRYVRSSQPRSFWQELFGARSKKPAHYALPCNNLSLHFQAGKISAIIGESGCGKTTLLRLIAQLEQPDEGSVDFVHPQRPECPPKIGIVFQEPRLLPWLNVWQNVSVAVRHLKEPLRDQRVQQTLAMVGLEHVAHAFPNQLSGGMAQRVGFARALVQEPDILLLDEAFSALDALTRDKLRREFLRMHALRPVTTILVTHDVVEAVLLCEDIFKLESGRLQEHWSIRAAYPRSLDHAQVSHMSQRILQSFF